MGKVRVLAVADSIERVYIEEVERDAGSRFNRYCLAQKATTG